MAIAHFEMFLVGYLSGEYFCDMAYRAGIYSYWYRQITASQVSVCDEDLMAYRLFGPRLRRQLTQKPDSSTFQLLNFAYLYPINCFRPAYLVPGKVEADVPYFMKYPDYQFKVHSTRLFYKIIKWIFKLSTIVSSW